MAIDEDLERIALQEERLRFERFDADTAWELGGRLRAAAQAGGRGVAIAISLNGHQLFACAMSGTSPDNADWIRRKRNVTQRYHRSSYALSLLMRKQQTTLAEKVGADLRDYATAGGCFPIRLRGSECVGDVTVSGLPQRADHELIVEVLCAMLGQPYAELALGEE